MAERSCSSSRGSAHRLVRPPFTPVSSGTTGTPLEQDGYYLSGLYPEGYDHYDRENFIATLNDWGWKGPEAERPDWCTDQPWGVEPWPPEET